MLMKPKATVEKKEANAAMKCVEYSERNSALIRQVRRARRKIAEYTSSYVMLINIRENTYESKMTGIKNSV